MQRPQQIHPVNPLPPVVVALALLIMGIEAVFSLGSHGIIGGPEAVGWRNVMIQTYGFNTDIFHWMMENQRFPVEHMQRFLTYSFVHGSFTHALLATVMLLALGKFVAETLRGVKTLILFLGSAAFGALVFGLVSGPQQQPWLIGAYPGIYGLIGCFTCVLWLRLGQMGAQRGAAFQLLAVLMGFQLLFGLLFGGGLDWVADLAASLMGFVLSFLLIPGGWQSFLARLRNDR